MWFDQPQGGHPNIHHWCHDSVLVSVFDEDGRSGLVVERTVETNWCATIVEEMNSYCVPD